MDHRLHLPSSSSKPHIVLIPFMAKGHTIPLLHLANLLLHRNISVTIFTTPANHPFVSQSLSQSQTHNNNNLSIVDLPFPRNVRGVPEGAESTDKLPSMALLVPFVRATRLMQPSFDQELEKIHTQVTFIVSDGFLPWTLESASRFGIPRLSFLGMSYYAGAVSRDAAMNGLLSLHEADGESFTLVKFPWIQMSRSDFNAPFDQRDPTGPHLELIAESVRTTDASYGLVVNSFNELEEVYADYYLHERGVRAWSIGPLCLANKLQRKKMEKKEKKKKKPWMDFLDQKLIKEIPVLYIAFGTQARISKKQLQEIGLGLEEAEEICFLWVLRESGVEVLGHGFESKVKGRGMVVTEWVDQEEILEHRGVGGFLSHCGWNSVMEGVCAGVPILAWPMMAEQGLNAKMVVEEIKVGVRIGTVDGSLKGFVSAETLKSAVTEVMDIEKGRKLREKAKAVAEAAIEAMREGGSSWIALNNLIIEIQREREREREREVRSF